MAGHGHSTCSSRTSHASSPIRRNPAEPHDSCPQVDLKDKWRNLVRQKLVDPLEFPSPEGRSKPRSSSGLEEASHRPPEDPGLASGREAQGGQYMLVDAPDGSGGHRVSGLWGAGLRACCLVLRWRPEVPCHVLPRLWAARCW